MDSDVKTTLKEASSSLCVRRIMILHDNLQFDEANKFIGKLPPLTFSKVIKELPMSALISTFPASIKILEILFVRFHYLDEHLRLCISFGDTLKPDRVVANLVKLLALQRPVPSNTKGLIGFTKNNYQTLTKEKFDLDHPMVISSKNILRVILIHQPTILKDLASRKASLDEALRSLRNHGPVGAADQSLTSLHDAIRLEVSSAIYNFKEILLRLNMKETANQPKRTAILRSISRATSETMTNRLNTIVAINHNSAQTNDKKRFHEGSTNLKLEELQDRLESNQVLLNTVEPIICIQPLQELILTLHQRINYDKQVLSQFNQLRKELQQPPQASGSLDDSISSIHHVLSLFVFGYNQVLNLISDSLPPKMGVNSNGLEMRVANESSITKAAMELQRKFNGDDDN